MKENKTGKHLLAVLGSPHTAGSTAAMLDYTLDLARKDGWSVTVIHLYHKQIAYCTGCRSCVKTGQCVIQDDIQEIASHLKNCNRVILAAPTYWANVPAIVKNMFDRLMGTAMEETAAFPQPRLSSCQDYLLLTACNTPFPFSRVCGQSNGTLRAMNEFFRTSGMKRLGQVVFTNAKGTGKLPAGIQKKIGRVWK